MWLALDSRNRTSEVEADNESPLGRHSNRPTRELGGGPWARQQDYRQHEASDRASKERERVVMSGYPFVHR